MTEQHQPKGLVEFRQPAAKLVADMPGDEEVREHLEEMQENYGFPGGCSVVNTEQQEKR